MTAPAARLIRVTGQVQGVGFRPFVHRLALRHRLTGWVRNTTGEVQIEVEGAGSDLQQFLAELVSEAPPLATIDSVDVASTVPHHREDFAILESATNPSRPLAPPPDAGMCGACEAELFDPLNGRYQYPFITCTDCGPRYTVIRAMPYDRERTSMAAFHQCPTCLTEYHDPADRRYHSESNSCARCGPRLWFAGPTGETAQPGVDPIAAAAALVRTGGILAIRGLGGFQLAVDATSDQAVERLRSRKRREAKPLAVMVRTLAEVLEIAEVSEAEAAALVSAARPIVLLEPRSDASLAVSVAPGLLTVGVMLPAAPLHRLLLELTDRPVVMTSGNTSEEPIAIGNDEAIERLRGIADGFLLHDRDIVGRYDDSVLRVVDNQPVLLRRARGYSPRSLQLPIPSPVPLVAVGPHLKNTFTLVDRDRALVSQHIGDLENLETLDHFRATLAAYRRLFQLEPHLAVHDLHPGYLSTRVAEELRLPLIAVQHHHAHIAAVLAEHGETGPAIGVAYDGTGYGDDGQTWGAEILVADLVGYRREAQLRYVPLPGGDRAARAPWRSALGWAATGGLIGTWRRVFAGVDPEEFALAESQITRRLNAPLASSMGRLFDAAAAILGVCCQSGYEGQAAMELEALAGRRPGQPIASSLLAESDGRIVIDPIPLLAALAALRDGGADPADLAADFHASVAWFTEQAVRRVADASGLRVVALGGGVFQNGRLLSSVRTRLEAAKLRVLVPKRLPPNDGGVSYGQAAIGAARLASGVH